MAMPASPAGAQVVGCESQQSRLNELKAMNLFASEFLIEAAQRALNDCRDRVVASEHQTLVSERSRAGNAYANATREGSNVSWDERNAAHIAWKEADEAVRNHAGYDPNQPYNDGLSDFERYYCLQQRDENSANTVPNVEVHDQSGGERTYTSNMISATCWD